MVDGLVAWERTMGGVRGDGGSAAAEVGVVVGDYSSISTTASANITRSDSSNNYSKDTAGAGGVGGVLPITSS